METSRGYLNSFKTVFILFVILIIVFLVISIWFVKPERDNDFYIEYLFSDFIPVIIGIILAYYYPYRLLKRAKQKRGLREKFSLYRIAIFIRWILILLVSIYCTLGYLLTHKYIFIYTSLFSIIVLIINRINKQTICEDLDLSSKERNILYNPNSSI